MNPLSIVGHRPWPLPATPWIMHQCWHDLLFAHWPVPAEMLRPLVHDDLEIDTYHGQAWLGIIPFRLSEVRVRWLPTIPLVEHFNEINVRTYVMARGKPGITFLSLDAGNPLVTAFARPWFHMPYYTAETEFRKSGSTISFCSKRREAGGQGACFCVVYEPVSAPRRAAKGSLEEWLAERYCFYSSDSRGRLYRCDAHHAPWLLQDARARIVENTLAGAQNVELPPAPPLLHYARSMEALIWPVVRVGSGPVKAANERSARLAA